jgi:hypothetical protein
MKVLQIVAGVSWETSFVAPLQLYGGYPLGSSMRPRILECWYPYGFIQI